MRRAISVSLLAAIAVASALGQSVAPASGSSVSATAVSVSGVTAPPHPSWMTDTVVFTFFFKHVTVTESHADELTAKGKDDSSERHLFKTLAHLPDQEEALLKTTAADTETAMTAFMANANSVMRGLKQQYPTKASLPPAAVQQLQALDSQKQQLVQTHMAALQAGMTPSRFQQVYNFVWGTEAPRIHPLRPGAKAPSGAKPPARP